MFNDRQDAGRKLAKKLKDYKDDKGIIVLGIARGGVVVAKEIADFLHVCLKVMVIKKIGSPYNPELAIGAVSPKSTIYWDYDSCLKLNLSQNQMDELSEKAAIEQKRREAEFGLDTFESLKGKVVILADDGIATGITAMAGAEFLRKKNCKKIVLAAPVVSSDVVKLLKDKFDRIVIVREASDLHAVGQFYKNFEQVTNMQVLKLI